MNNAASTAVALLMKLAAARPDMKLFEELPGGPCRR